MKGKIIVLENNVSKGGTQNNMFINESYVLAHTPNVEISSGFTRNAARNLR